MVQSPVQLPVSGSQSRARGRRVESMVAEQGRPTDPMPPQLKTPYHENSSIVAGVDGVVEPLDLVRFRSRWPPRPGLPPPAGAKRPRRRKRTVALPLLTGTRPPARAQRPPTPAGAKRPRRRKQTVAQPLRTAAQRPSTPRRSEATPPSQTAFRPAFDHYIPIQYTSLSLYSFYPLGMFFFL